MLHLVKSEVKKMRRTGVFIAGMGIMTLSPLLSVLQYSSLTEPLKNMGFSTILNSVIWYNMSLFLPITLTFLGGYIINKEYVCDTLKNLKTIPLRYGEILSAKLITLLLFDIILCAYSFLMTFLLAAAFYPEGGQGNLLLEFGKVIVMGICIYIAIMPIIVWSGGKKNRYFAGTIIAFVYGLLGIPMAGRGANNYYPITAGLSIIRYEGDLGNSSASYSIGIAIISLVLMLCLSIIIMKSHREND